MKILIADDHALFRDGLALNLEQLDKSATIIQAGSYTKALKILEENSQPDLIIVDLDMPDKTWEEGIGELQAKAPQSRFAVITATEDMRIIRQVMDKGVNGYIPKRSEPGVILAALKLILAGGCYLPPVVLNSLNKTVSESKSGVLTHRQFEVLRYISQGLSNKQIAHEMSVSEATVKLHINAMLKALKATNRTQALVNAQKIGLI